MKIRTAGVVFTLAVAQLGFAQQNQAGGTALTIYNSDLAVVRTSVDLDLKQGANEVTTTKVTSQLEPDSVVLRDPAEKHPVQVVEQNYDAALVSQSWMLQKYEGQTVDFQTGGPGSSSVSGKFCVRRWRMSMEER